MPAGGGGAGYRRWRPVERERSLLRLPHGSQCRGHHSRILQSRARSKYVFSLTLPSCVGLFSFSVSFLMLVPLVSRSLFFSLIILVSLALLALLSLPFSNIRLSSVSLHSSSILFICLLSFKLQSTVSCLLAFLSIPSTSIFFLQLISVLPVFLFLVPVLSQIRFSLVFWLFFLLRPSYKYVSFLPTVNVCLILTITFCIESPRKG